MAEQIAHDVVNQSLSVGDQSPSDVHADKSIRQPTGEVIADTETGTDDDGGKFGQDDGVWPGSTGHAILIGQSHIMPETVEPGSVEPSAQFDNKNHDSDVDCSLSRSHSVGDLSGTASDTDARKADPTTVHEGPRDNSNTAKKLTTFKPVSFAKYSAAKVAGINSAAKVSADKGISSSANSSTASLQQGSRPRLVAKSASGLRDNSSKLFKQGGKTTGGEPDPMQVWNKNRPAPSPSTKHLTDEELKQQYGIHMTSRIEADGESKEAKWADIDDDEDDWAPESIEWADGTKVTLSHTSALPVPEEAVKPDESPGEQPGEARVVRPKAPQVISSVGPNATILKLGASAERQQAQKTTSSQKGPTEKAAQSTVKSPAPVPAKSPWAALPPMDKPSPITINHHETAPRQARHDQMPQAGPSPSTANAPSPAKEISADDFNRSWRDSQPGQPRELFMPSSGRYEAVGENRRKSFRNDQGFRAPALLQRPSQNDPHAPAEPSPAFQTNRTSTDQERSHWDRRRASSIQSGGSGQFGRRMSATRPLGADAIAVPSEPSQAQKESSQTAPSDGLTKSRGVHVQHSTNMAPPSSTAEPSAPASDLALIAEQKRLMQESARLAVQRRREEEQREEAARKERIRLKLEQLGPPPDQKTRRQDPPPEVTTKPEESVAQVSSPPKPPVPEPTGKPKQYGMMKVHHPDNVKKFTSLVERPGASPETKYLGMDQPPRSESAHSPEPVMNGLKAANEGIADPHSDEAHNHYLPTEDKLQAWKSNLTTNEPLHGWKTRNHHPGPAAGNLWGPPNHDKALGNGTFDQGLTGLSGRDLSVRNSTPQHSWLNGAQPSHDLSPQPPPKRTFPAEDIQAAPAFPSSEQRSLAANSEADSLRPVGKPLPIGPPQTHKGNQRWQQPSNPRAAKNGITGWNNFQTAAAREDRAENERIQQDTAPSLEEEARAGTHRPVPYTFNETWKQVEVSDHTGERQITSAVRGTINTAFPATHAYSAPGASFNGDRAANGLPIRGSRFFPTEARRAVTYSHPTRSRSPSPPPAEGLGSPHPVYGGDTKRPVINFPVPKAVVKLPKPQEKLNPVPPPPAPPRTFAAAVAAQPSPPPPPPPTSRTASQPFSSTWEWQNRINDLVGKKSLPKRQVLAVTSSSREPLDVIPINLSAAVSLPPSAAGLSKDGGKVTSKAVEEEEDLFEDREAASRPLVHVPRDVPELLRHPARTPQFRSKGRFTRQEVDAVSICSLDMFDDAKPGFKGRGDLVFCIRLPGSNKPTRKTMAKKEADGEPISRGGKGQNFHSNKHRKGPHRSRESSGSFQAAPNNNSSSSSSNNNNNNNNNNNINTKTPPAVNGSVPTPPRSGFSHNANNHSGWKGGHSNAAGLAH